MLADDDALVAVLFAVNGHIHVDDAVVALGKLRDLDGRAVRDLLIEAQQQLFAHELGADLLFGHIGDHIVREQLRSGHSQRRQLV